MPEHLVEARLLDVQDLALERQDGLEAPVAPLLGRAAGRVALDDVDLAERGIALLAVGELARQRAAVERALAPDELARLARRLARARRVDRLHDDPLRDAGFSSRNAPSFSLTIASTMPLTSLLPSLVLVCPSNCGCGILTLMTAVRPSRTSSPLMRRVLQVLGEVVLRGVAC